MRITGGRLGGRIIHAPANLPVRPTTDFAKSALFNILNNYFDFQALQVLDLFAGAGSISYEFASREAVSVTSVDKEYKCISFIKKTCNDLHIENIRCIQSDVIKFITNCQGKWDIIFADPPFAMTETDTIPKIVFERKLLNKDGWLVVEHQSKRILNSTVKPVEIRKYGNCAFSIYTNDEQEMD